MISAKSLQTLVRLLSLKPLKINGSKLTAGGVKKDSPYRRKNCFTVLMLLQPCFQVSLLLASCSVPCQERIENLGTRSHTATLFCFFCLDQQGQLTISAFTSLKARLINLHNKGEVGHLACFLYNFCVQSGFQAVWFQLSILRPKPKVIILAIHQGRRQPSKPIKTPSKYVQ